MLSRASLVKCLFHVGEVVAIIPLSVFLSESVGVFIEQFVGPLPACRQYNLTMFFFESAAIL